MPSTLKIIETEPDAWPEIPGLPTEIDAATVWQRLEAWIATRWGERAVVFVAEGPGEWLPPLQPATITGVEIWIDDAWAEVSRPPTALGGILLDQLAHYRIETTVGSDEDPPAVVLEAALRLGKYLVTVAANDFENAMISEESSDGVDSITYASPNAAARAIQYSGAGDLLRRYRNLGAA